MSLLGRLIWLGLGLCLLCLAPALGQEKPPKNPWTGKLADGRVITRADLEQIIQEHNLWIESKGKKGKRAKLGKANLQGAYLRHGPVNLDKKPLLKEKILDVETFLDKDKLMALYPEIIRGANLSKAELYEANLSKAYLSDGNFSWANLKGANLSKASMMNTNLKGAILTKANVSEAFLLSANLSKAYLDEANLSKTILITADLSKTDLSGANLNGSYLLKANLSWALLTRASLSGADLREANLSGASLMRASLSGADLREANLSGAILQEADLSRVIYEPQPGSLPEVSRLIRVRGLFSLRFVDSSHALVELQKIYQKGGMREQEREVTFALNHCRREKLWQRGGFLNRLESLFHLVFFEWTCDYGMTPSRPLLIMFLGLFLFILPYLLALRSQNPRAGIWLLLLPNRVLDRNIKDHPVKLTFRTPFRPLPAKRWARFRARGRKVLRSLRLAFYFSLLSAFNLGWRELNVGTWITRIQKREYNLRGTGWVRMLSGLQALLSVYLLALWALTYFGRPFE